MAKRKRLSPAQSDYLEAHLTGPFAPAPSRAPIADVAGEAAAAAAFEEVAGELTRAREEGRLVLDLPLEEIDSEHLIRDRIDLDPEALDELKQSIRERGQQTPIEVVDRGEGRHPRYGLLSGWRRLAALRALCEEANGLQRYTRIRALLRLPRDRADAYRAMVEENEIRAGLSFFERARIVARALEAGVFAREKDALGGLFASVSYSKRSKIKSFLPVVSALDGVLAHPARLPEHLGLALARALKDRPDLGERIARAHAALPEVTPEAEAEMLRRVMETRPAPAPKPAQSAETERKPADRTLIEGLSIAADPARGRILLKGRRITPDFVAELEDWLKSRD
ncbi:ParB/RepB/Spo0J family partition protein [Roseivivax lentus]|uniref:ParB/RepB/Spo0J family partition protein n=1 Tax=Roseivivax lentus TaxID=633194 RepID=A0A1N7Q542_9RHOB|nr:ParB N-terminal domain-containing protein [Roseivivax lentus]SIT17974.1 ParB/RepB/Spo0J family partition protein [Roseivivax lentus]